MLLPLLPLLLLLPPLLLLPVLQKLLPLRLRKRTKARNNIQLLITKNPAHKAGFFILRPTEREYHKQIEGTK
jgi:hypothetical protein